MRSTPVKFTPAYQSSTPPPVNVSGNVISPRTPEGDDYFGLSMGTNGTAAISRRATAELVITANTGVRGFEWVRANGGAPVGITLVPSPRVDGDDEENEGVE